MGFERSPHREPERRARDGDGFVRLPLGSPALRVLLEAAPVGLFLNDERGTCIFANEECAKLVGAAPSELLGSGWERRVHPADRPAVLRCWEETMRAGRRFDMEYRFVSNDGAVRWVLGRAVALREADGTVRGFFGSLTDVDERRRAGAEREELLEREQAARREAEHANRVKNEFLATLSHELRTPLNAIVGWADVLRDEHGKASEALDAIVRNALAQNQLIEDLLDIGRLDRGALRLELRRCAPSAVVADAVATVRPAAVAKSVELRSSGSPTRDVIADPGRLQQVVWNLLSNAVKFTPPGGAVDVRLVERDDVVEIAVADTGRGIAPEVLPHVFDPFWRDDAGAADAHAGLGLGLAIARQLAEMHGGSIAAHSAGRDRGATFTVRLPAAGEPSAR
ncbi:MAG TPA: PAS domain-containing sensor histidine kinase [Candidatus Binatia bacterium]|nr:PAS domain-containing sensor histidine kinase [Candidatus Binatia bacterium]